MVDERMGLARELVALWAELLGHEAKVTQVPLDSPPEVLRARIAHEKRRLRALGEGHAA